MRNFFSLLFSFFAFLSVYAYDVEIDGIYYNLIKKANYAEVTYKGKTYDEVKSYSGDIVIPDEITVEGQNYKVTSIVNMSFENCPITSIKLGNNLRSTGNQTFWNCKYLHEVDLGNSIEEIGTSAFNHCRNLTCISIPNSVKYIKGWCFSDCPNLRTVSIGNKVKTIEASAFYQTDNIETVIISDLSSWCKIKFADSPIRNNTRLFLKEKELKELVIPKNVTEISENAFFRCASIEKLIIPNNVNKINKMAFRDCVNLKKVEFSNTITELPVGIFMGCSSLEEINLGENIKIINQCAFSECDLRKIHIYGPVTTLYSSTFCYNEKLSSVILPKTINKIDAYCFENCKDLERFYCYAITPPSVGYETFNNDYLEAVTLYVPLSSIKQYKSVSPWNEFGTIKAIEGIEDIAKPVEEIIDAIGNVEYTDVCKQKIDLARSGYDALTKEQQDFVTNYSTLLNAEMAYKNLEKITGIVNIETNNNCTNRKFFVNGKIVIIKNGKKYNIYGQCE